MFKLSIPHHLERLKKIDSDSAYLVYKGFPVEFLRELSKQIPFFSDHKKLINDGKIDLKFIESNTQELIAKLFAGTKESQILFYEELINLNQNINIELFKSEFHIITNDLYDEYPNQSTIKNIDIENNIELDTIDFPENDLFNFFYVDSKVYHDENYVQYPELKGQLSNVIYHEYFEELAKNVSIEPIKSDTASNSKNFVYFPSSDSSYIKFKYGIFFNLPVTTTTLKIDKYTYKNTERINELRKLKYLFSLSDQILNFVIDEPQVVIQYRDALSTILAKYWNSDEFRELLFYKNPSIDNERITISQGNIIEEIIQESEKAIFGIKFNDIFITAPTGSGKSLLFQIPAIFIAERYDRVTIVVSPLKALMYDQVISLKEKGIQNCAFINSDISFLEREDIIEKTKGGEISILYMSPELLLSYDLRMFIGDRKVGLFVIDEAHLVTTWGRDFRVDYWYLGNYIAKIRKYSEFNFPVIALTATAVYTGKNDIVFETVGSLNMQLPKLYVGNIRRDEISFDIKPFNYQGSHEEKKIENTLARISEFITTDQKVIVYFPWINHIRHIDRRIEEGKKDRVGIFYSSVDKVNKKVIIEQFKESKILVILATKAFGMGVDISDIDIIYHHAPSGNLEDYVQEIGRVARDKSLKGYAITDYCAKDLKFTKILYGLSSIKQYQTKLAIKKINDIYQYKKKRNLLLSVDDFSFIFSENTQDIDTKVKSTLLLIEKDFIQKYGYNVILVRPKSLFSLVYAKIDHDIASDFLRRYGEFCEKVKKPKSSTQYIGKGKSKYKRIVQDNETVYSIRLNALWERYFFKDTFPMIKKKFFDCTLFEGFEGKISPRYCIQIRLKKKKDETLKNLNVYFYVIEQALNSFKGKYFKKQSLDKALREQNLKDRVMRTRITDLLLTLYTGYEAIDKNDQSKFIVYKGTGGNVQYRVINYAFPKVKHGTFQKLERMYPEDEEYIFERYIDVHSKKTKGYIEVAHLLESFDLANYEMHGGLHPLLFIRINDPYKLDNVANDNEYKNLILKDIDQRHDYSVQVMDQFFTKEYTDEDRWRFIEDYFLGRDLIEEEKEDENDLDDLEPKIEILGTEIAGE